MQIGDRREYVQIQEEAKKLSQEYDSLYQTTQAQYSELTRLQSRSYFGIDEINYFNSLASDYSKNLNRVYQISDRAEVLDQKAQIYGDQYREGVNLVNIYDPLEGQASEQPRIPLRPSNQGYFIFGALLVIILFIK